jgi:hypothetical protein
MLLFSIYKELTDVVLISNMGFCTWADVNVVVIMAKSRRIGIRPAARDLTFGEGDQPRALTPAFLLLQVATNDRVMTSVQRVASA